MSRIGQARQRRPTEASHARTASGSRISASWAAPNTRKKPVSGQDAVAVFFAEVGDVRAARFEDPQAEQAEHRDQGEVVAANEYGHKRL